MIDRSVTYGILLGGVLTALACSEVPTTSPSSDGLSLKKGRPWFQADPMTVVTMPAPDDGSFNIRGDGRGDYVGGECGVSAKIFSPEDGGGSGDAVMDPGGNRIKRKDQGTCGDPPRAITIIYDTPLSGEPLADPTETHGTFQNMNKLWQAPEGTSETQAGFNSPRCNILRFKPELYPGSDKVLVERAGDVWTVHTKPDVVVDGTVIEHHDKAWCDTEQRFYHMPFTVTIRLKP